MTTFSDTSLVAAVNVCRYRNIELIEIVDRDVERLTGNRAVAAGRLDRDRYVFAPCVSRSIAAAVVTTPVLASIENRPSGLLVRL